MAPTLANIVYQYRVTILIRSRQSWNLAIRQYRQIVRRISHPTLPVYRVPHAGQRRLLAERESTGRAVLCCQLSLGSRRSGLAFYSPPFPVTQCTFGHLHVRTLQTSGLDAPIGADLSRSSRPGIELCRNARLSPAPFRGGWANSNGRRNGPVMMTGTTRATNRWRPQHGRCSVNIQLLA